MKPNNPYLPNSTQMVEIIIWQYKASKDGKFLDDIISIWTKPYNKNTPPYSHSEIEFVKVNLCFSAATRGDGKNRVRFEDRSKVLKHPERWDGYSCYFYEADVYEMFERALLKEGKKYYYVGIFLDFVMGFKHISIWFGKKLDEWYCSLIVYFVLNNLRKRVSPRRLTRWIMEDGFVLIKP